MARTNRLDFATIDNGNAIRLINNHLDDIAANILDPRTDSKIKRKLVVEITVTPDDEDRRFSDVSVQCKPKHAPMRGIKTRIAHRRQVDTGEIVTAEQQPGINPHQHTFSDVDPVTGEVLTPTNDQPRQ